MSRLAELIKELCPDGVEYKNLGELGKFYGGLTGKSKSDFSDGNATFITYKNVYLNPALNINPDDTVKIAEGESQRVLKYGDVVFTGSSETPDECGFSSVVTKEPERPLYLNSFCFFYRFDDIGLIRPDFAKHLFRSQNLRSQIGKTASGVTRYNVSKDKMSRVTIPLPPLPVQEEIVRILDNFTELTAGLTAELTARKKQYEYYRDSILESNNFPYKQLGELCKFVRGPFGGALKKECFLEEGYPVYEQQHAIYSKFDFRYYVSEDKFQELKRFEVVPNDLIMSCSGTMGKIAIIPPNAPRGIINQALLKLTAYNDVDVNYLKYCFESTIAKQMNDNARGGAIKNVASVAVLKKIEVKLPPLPEQQRIVDILDRFDTLCNDISSGLPAEIKARQQQYEYYRDKLLTFKNTDTKEA